MSTMKQAKELGEKITASLEAKNVEVALGLLSPILADPTPFPILDRIGTMVGAGPTGVVDALVDRIAQEGTMGGWVVIGSALGARLPRNTRGAFSRCRHFVAAADVWHATDILAERVPGPALVTDFESSLRLLASWRDDKNRWVRRAVGVSVHFWAKRSGGSQTLVKQARALLDLTEPLFEEREMDAVKGVGWGLKTLGKYYGDLVADWLREQTVERQRPHRAAMMRKATRNLSAAQHARATGRRPR